MNQHHCRARDLGVVVGPLSTGRHNAITDVAGVLVGHTTIDDGADLHTGVTAIVPSQLGPRTVDPAGRRVRRQRPRETRRLDPGGRTRRTGVADRPDRHAVRVPGRGRAAGVPDGPPAGRLSFNPLVGETNDGHLSDIRRRPITEEHVLAAITGASGEPPAEGCVGAGTGTTALGFKAGIGTSSRTVRVADRPATVGALVQSNFGGVLTALGVPLPVDELIPDADRTEPPGNSCMIVVATDAPLDARQLGRLARRAVFAMGRVGASYSNASGDYAIAFSTAPPDQPPIPDGEINPVFAAVMDAVEEALLNSLFTATTTSGRGHTSYAVPHRAVIRAVVGGRPAGGARLSRGRGT